MHNVYSHYDCFKYIFADTGELYSCGWNKNGQLGHSQESENVTLVRRVLGLPKVTKISCGWNHTLVISGGWGLRNNYYVSMQYHDALCSQGTGELFGWGSNSFGQLGLPDRGASNPVPLQLSREVSRGTHARCHPCWHMLQLDMSLYSCLEGPVSLR